MIVDGRRITSCLALAVMQEDHDITTANQRLFGNFAPKFVDLTDNVLFVDVWERPGLSKRDRSLVTVASLIAMNRPDQLRFHLARARENA